MAEVQMISEIEEPPTKVTRIELEGSAAHNDTFDGTEHSQEEWLSEGVLTDDDYNQTMEQDGAFSNMGNMSQDDSTNIDSLENTDNPDIDAQEYSMQAEVGDSQVNSESLQIQDNTSNLQIGYQESVPNIQIEFQDNGENVQDSFQNIQIVYGDHSQIGLEGNHQTEEQVMLNTVEETLNNFENSQGMEATEAEATNIETLEEDLGMFLIRKTDVKEQQKNSEEKEGEKDDGNDTDELLRMLGGDDNKDKKKKEILKTVKKKPILASQESTDDEDNIFEGATKITTMQVAKNVQIYRKHVPKKAVPEDSDTSSDEAQTMQKMLRVTQAPNKGMRTRNMSKPEYSNNQNSLLKKFVGSTATAPTPPATSTPLRTYRNTKLVKKEPQPTTKEANKPVVYKQEIRKPELRKPEIRKPELRKPELRKPELRKPETRKPETRKPEIVKPEVKKPEVTKPSSGQQIKQEMEKFIKQETLMDDEDFAMDEDLVDSDEEIARLKKKAAIQQLMKPEQMDEDMLSEEDSEPSDASFYDEMPSSESEDIEEWFALDIRAERAGDYIPLLGHKANELLAEEKKRVVKKLSILRENIQALAEKSKEQTKQIEDARRSLAELDAVLTHT